MGQLILVVEDEPAIADTIVYALKTEGFEPQWCSTGGAARDAVVRDTPALAVLDIGLPDCSGIDLARDLLARTALPIIFLTARSSEIDRVVGLELGADDYIPKPFSPRELVARVRAVLRRSAPSNAGGGPATSSPAPTGEFAIDHERRQIRYHGAALELSRYEYRILETLVRSPGRVFSRRELMEAAWDEPDVSLERTVDTHVKTIRRKLESISSDTDLIETRRGFGYSLRPSAAR